MTVLSLINTRILVGGADLTGFSNKVDMAATVDDKDRTTFADQGWKARAAGLKDVAGSLEGFWDAGDLSKPDDQLMADLATSQPWTVGPEGANVGQLAYLTRAVLLNYKTGAQVGELMPFSAGLSGDEPLARGSVLHDPGTARTATGTGTILQLGAVGALQRMFCTLHVLSVAGTTPSITVKLQSATTGAFSSPTDRFTFNAANAISGQWGASAVGAITDTYWRLAWTISGTTPSFLLVAAAGIATP